MDANICRCQHYVCLFIDWSVFPWNIYRLKNKKTRVSFNCKVLNNWSSPDILFFWSIPVLMLNIYLIKQRKSEEKINMSTKLVRVRQTWNWNPFWPEEASQYARNHPLTTLNCRKRWIPAIQPEHFSKRWSTSEKHGCSTKYTQTNVTGKLHVLIKKSAQSLIALNWTFLSAEQFMCSKDFLGQSVLWDIFKVGRN